MQPEFRQAGALDLLLNRDNPRHASKSNQEQVIEYLLGSEEVYNLARHMSQYGVNPLEVIAVFADDDGNLIVAEGNRRVCAAQLLTDPEKAPAAVRSRFKALAQKAPDVSTLNVAVFDNYETAQPWLQVLHDGEQDGIGRRRWKPDQKARATTSKSTNALAVALLDYAESNSIISGDLRKDIRVSTATRYLQNPDVRGALGITSPATSDKIEITVSPEIFNEIIRKFFNDIQSGKLHSRSVTEDWLAYALEITGLFGAGRTAPSPVSSPVAVRVPAPVPARSQGRSSRARIVSPDTRTIGRSARIIAALNKLSSVKLSSLYSSLTGLRLDEHPALLTTGAWAFVEALTALHGRNQGTEFVGYMNGRFGSWGFAKDKARDCRLSLEYISNNGNAEKHSSLYTVIDARNLHNYFAVLDDVFLILLEECVAFRCEDK